jgi:hypothetical protein
MCFQVCRAGFVFQKFRKWVAASDKGLTMWCHSVLHGSDECSDNENKVECNLKLSRCWFRTGTLFSDHIRKFPLHFCHEVGMFFSALAIYLNKPQSMWEFCKTLVVVFFLNLAVVSHMFARLLKWSKWLLSQFTNQCRKEKYMVFDCGFW